MLGRPIHVVWVCAPHAGGHTVIDIRLGTLASTSQRLVITVLAAPPTYFRPVFLSASPLPTPSPHPPLFSSSPPIILTPSLRQQLFSTPTHPLDESVPSIDLGVFSDRGDSPSPAASMHFSSKTVRKAPDSAASKGFEGRRGGWGDLCVGGGR